MSEENLIGQVIGGCRIDSFIGKGGMGKVFRAHNLNLDIPVAIKVMSANLGTSRELIERFILEARAAARLHSEHIVRVFDVGEEQGLYFLQMEFVQGESLSSYLSRNRPLEIPLSLHFLQQVVRGLGNAHDENIIHRDIKPDNILISSKGILKIADFGLVKLIAENNNLTATGQVLGTPYYISPEQCEGKPTDGRSDIYSLGIVMFYMLTAKLPFEGDSSLTTVIARLQNEAPLVTSVRSDIPIDIQSLVQKMMSRQVEGRYQNTEDLLDDINRLMQVYCQNYKYSAANLGIKLAGAVSPLMDTNANTIVDSPSKVSNNTVLTSSTKSLFKHNSKTLVSTPVTSAAHHNTISAPIITTQPQKKSGFLWLCVGIALCAVIAGVAYKLQFFPGQVQEEKERLAQEEKERLAQEEKERLAKKDIAELILAQQSSKAEDLLKKFENEISRVSSKEEMKKIKENALKNLEDLERETRTIDGITEEMKQSLPNLVNTHKSKMKRIFNSRIKEIKGKNSQNDKKEKKVDQLKKEAAFKFIEGLKIIADGVRFPRMKRIINDFIVDLENDIKKDNFDQFLDLLNKNLGPLSDNKDFFQNRDRLFMELEQIESMHGNDDDDDDDDDN